MKTIKRFTVVTLVALSAMLLFQTSITQAGDCDSRGDDNDQGNHGQPISNPFAILLDGVYKPVAKGAGPKDNLGLTQVDLSDGTFSKVKILPVAGLPGDDDENEAIGTLYVRFGGGVCAYDLPGGALYARFTGSDTERKDQPDGSWTVDGTFKLVILETTGVYQPFAGGHIHMVDILKFRAGEKDFLEFCYCHFHRNLFTP
jgi:hypothetical protein